MSTWTTELAFIARDLRLCVLVGTTSDVELGNILAEHILDLPESVRIAMARALLADTGVMLTEEHNEVQD
jgi:hypothetical protein